MFQRSAYQIIKNRMEEKRKFIQVIMGPRQVGKTTLVAQVLKAGKIPHHFASADEVANSNTQWLNGQWEIARIKSGKKKEEFILALDEIQKIANWSETIKKLWDEDTKLKNNIKVILLGSSRVLIQQGLTESMAGRFETHYLGHWSYAEMKKAFKFTPEQFVFFGGYPGGAELIKDEKRWCKYIKDSLIETSISKDILMLTRIEKPALMKRLFELGCLHSAQILSYTKILGQLQDAGNTTTLAHYLQLLHTAGLLGGLEKYADVIRQRGSSPKFQVHNTALISAQMQATYGESIKSNELWGRLVESAVGAHLLNASITHEFELFYWRHKNEEVDFVLKKGKKVIGLEVKTGNKTNTKGMQTFYKEFKPAKVLLIGPGGLHWKDFLELNPAELF